MFSNFLKAIFLPAKFNYRQFTFLREVQGFCKVDRLLFFIFLFFNLSYYKRRGGVCVAERQNSKLTGRVNITFEIRGGFASIQFSVGTNLR